MSLTEKTCVPCQGGIPPIEEAEAKRMLGEVPGWQLTEGATRLERDFTFPDFQTCLDFVNKVGALAEEEGHHPDICFGWGKAHIVWFTHKIKGLHENDFIMAAKTNRLAG
jgi:4a-hydroxytetrahydrobiopterin dehydratase